MRPGAVTHAVDMEQRSIELARRGEDGLVVTSPPDPSVAPPGWYMLFALDARGVPSLARWIQLDPGAPEIAAARAAHRRVAAPGAAGRDLGGRPPRPAAAGAPVARDAARAHPHRDAAREERRAGAAVGAPGPARARPAPCAPGRPATVVLRARDGRAAAAQRARRPGRPRRRGQPRDPAPGDSPPQGLSRGPAGPMGRQMPRRDHNPDALAVPHPGRGRARREPRLRRLALGLHPRRPADLARRAAGRRGDLRAGDARAAGLLVLADGPPRGAAARCPAARWRCWWRPTTSPRTSCGRPWSGRSPSATTWRPRSGCSTTAAAPGCA